MDKRRGWLSTMIVGSLLSCSRWSSLCESTVVSHGCVERLGFDWFVSFFCEFISVVRFFRSIFLRSFFVEFFFDFEFISEFVFDLDSNSKLIMKEFVVDLEVSRYPGGGTHAWAAPYPILPEKTFVTIW